MEIETESVSRPLSGIKTCKKSWDHGKFMTIKEFQEEELPPPYQNEKDLQSLVFYMALLSVRIKVKGSSKNRPKTFPYINKLYPFSGDQHRKTPRQGSGWVADVRVYTEDDNQNCYCRDCRTKGEIRKSWAAIAICTAAHVIFDDFEGEMSECHMFYFRDDLSLSGCPSFSQAVKVKSDVYSDSSNVTYILHDVRLAEKVMSINKMYEDLCPRLRHKYFDRPEKDTEDIWPAWMSNLNSKLIKLHDLMEHATNQVEEFESCVHQEMLLEMLQKGGLGLDMDKRDSLDKRKIDEMLRLYDLKPTISSFAEDFDKFKNSNDFVGLGHEEEKVEQFQNRYYTFSDYADFFESETKQTINKFDINQSEDEEKRKLHPQKGSNDSLKSLVILISHPHGCGLRISFGEVVSREGSSFNHSRYIYNNATCPGSSGGRVFILDKVRRLVDHSHSGLKCETENGYYNISAIIKDP